MSPEVIVIGSGPAGVHAAQALVDQGIKVTMVDGGESAPRVLTEPVTSWTHMRKTKTDQWRWFLGEDLSGIPVEGLKGGLGGGMTSGNRKFVLSRTEEALPVKTTDVPLVQTLAEGGLGAVWGATSAYLSDAMLEQMGLPVADMQEHYRAVTKRIGVSGPPSVYGTQPALPLDHHAEAMHNAYEAQKPWWDESGMKLGQPHSAVLTENLGDRHASSTFDMDYYSDAGKSVYRPQWTLEQLKKNPLFTYQPHVLVEAIRERDDGVVIEGRSLAAWSQGHAQIVHGTHAVLCAGAVNSARILLASLDKHDPVPFVAKSHAFIAGLRLQALGKGGPEHRMSSCQLVMEEAPYTPSSFCAQLYSYRSLLLFRLLGSLPLPTPLAMKAAALLSPALVIADVRFATPTPNATLQWTGDMLDVKSIATEESRKEAHATLARVRAGLRKSGVTPVKTMLLPVGSSSHYGCTIPVNGSVLGCDADGQVHGMSRTLVADASMFVTLPAHPHTLTIMANANRIGTILGNRLR